MPVQLTVVPLNSTNSSRSVPGMDSELPPPLSVTLHHVCLMSTRNHMTLSCTHRYRSKFVTLIIHKAWHAGANSTRHHRVEHVQSGYSALHTGVAEGRNHCVLSPSSRGPSVWWSDGTMSGQQHADGPCVAAKPVQNAADAATAMPPPLKLPAPCGCAEACARSDVLVPQAMDLGSRPGSEAVLMDTSVQGEDSQKDCSESLWFGGEAPIFGVGADCQLSAAECTAHAGACASQQQRVHQQDVHTSIDVGSRCDGRGDVIMFSCPN